MNNRIEREDETFSDWAEILDAKAREHSYKERQLAILLEWLSLVVFVLFIVVCAMWAKLT